MAGTTTTPNMGLPNPVPGVETGPQYATDIQSCFNILDQHNHSPPNGGVQINPSGININASLAFNNQLATGLQAVIFTNQSSLSTLNALYTINGDLWYNDASNPVQITLGGNVLANSSGISDMSGNSAAFSTGVLVVQNASTAPDSIQCGSILLGNTGTPSSGFVTISPPSSTTSYALTLPTVPASTCFAQIDSSGNISASVPVAAGQQISASSGLAGISSPTFSAVTNLSVSITTQGRPVMIFLTSDGSTSSFQTAANDRLLVQIRRGSTTVVFETEIGGAAAMNTPVGGVLFLDTPTAGSYTYNIYAASQSGSVMGIFAAVLVAYELK